MSNISAVFSKGGATATHTPGYATMPHEETEKQTSATSTSTGNASTADGDNKSENKATKDQRICRHWDSYARGAVWGPVSRGTFNPLFQFREGISNTCRVSDLYLCTRVGQF
jgi:hypothetical protein